MAKEKKEEGKMVVTPLTGSIREAGLSISRIDERFFEVSYMNEKLFTVDFAEGTMQFSSMNFNVISITGHQREYFVGNRKVYVSFTRHINPETWHIIIAIKTMRFVIRSNQTAGLVYPVDTYDGQILIHRGAYFVLDIHIGHNRYEVQFLVDDSVFVYENKSLIGNIRLYDTLADQKISIQRVANAIEAMYL